ncbi:MAG: AAA family ATPase [Planctomycetes bacterium]|nr:AAA family ATPase [Planctomycetota bacterium]
MDRPDPLDELKLLVRSRHPLITIETVEEQRALELIKRLCNDLDCALFLWTSTEGMRRLRPFDSQPAEATVNPRGALGYVLNSLYPGLFVFLDLLPQLAHAQDHRALREVVDRAANLRQTIVLIEQKAELQPALERVSVPFDLAFPDEAEIRQLVTDTAKEAAQTVNLSVEFKKGELAAFLRNLRGLTAGEIKRAVWRAILDDNRLDTGDVAGVLKIKQEMIREVGVLEYIQPEVTLDDIGGLDHLKSWLNKRKSALSKEAADFGLAPPRGALLLGVQGAGKSMAAKAVAAAWNLPLLKLDPGQLYDKYVGQTEKQLRRALRTAESIAPVVLWIDEIEKAFASAAAQSTDGGLSQRMFGSLLGWMQDHKFPIFVVATANDISALPPELMRKGRFDEIFFVDLPGPVARKQIFETHLARRKRKPADFDLARLVDASEGFSGAEIEQAILSAMYGAFADGLELDTNLLVEEIKRTRPLSVTMAERIAALRAWAAERCVNAG